MMDHSVRCAMKLTQATCDAESDCSWSGGDGCLPSTDFETELVGELTAGTMNLLGPMFACGFSPVTSCPTDTCVVYGDTCSINDATIDAAFEDASLGEIMKMTLKCSAHASQTSCVANSECVWTEVSEEDAEAGFAMAGDMVCELGDDAYLVVVAKYCEIDTATGGYSPVASAGVADAVDSAVLGAALAAGLAALA